MRNIAYYSFASLMLLTACNNDELLPTDSYGSNNIRITVINEDIEMLSTSTRIVPTANGENRFSFPWQPNDQIAIFGDKGTATGWAFVKLIGEGGSTSGDFDGVFKRSEESTYFSFYPCLNFTSSTDEKAIPVDYTNQKQTSDADPSHLRNYVYYTGTINQETNRFTGKHVGSLIRIELVDPDYSDCTSIKLITDGEFVTKGTIDLTTTTVSAAPSISATETSSIFTLGYNSNGATLAGNKITAYAMAAPASLTGHTLKATLKHKNNFHDKEYTLSVEKYSNGTLSSILDDNDKLTEDIRKGTAYKLSSNSYQDLVPYLTFNSKGEQFFTPIIHHKNSDDQTNQCENVIEFSVGNGPWKELGTADKSTRFENYNYLTEYSIPFGGSKGNLRLRGKCLTSGYLDNDFLKFNFKNNNSVECCGDLTTLVDYEQYTAIPTDIFVCFDYLFKDCTQLFSAPSINVSSMANWSLRSIYEGCTNLKEVPDFTMSEVRTYCLLEAFKNCTSLVNAPALPAMTLGYECYGRTFEGCTNLVNAPKLPATTLAEECYVLMFSRCSSLKTAPELQATTLADGCYSSMFSSCTNLVNAPALPATELKADCYNCMFFGCTNLVNAPILPATELADGCYAQMFRECSSLNHIDARFTTIPTYEERVYGDTTPLHNWVYGVSGTGTFVKNSNATWNVTGTDGVPTGWTIQTK